MSCHTSLKPATMTRVVCDGRRRSVAQAALAAGGTEFKLGDRVRSIALVSNDGIDPRKDIGETLVERGDTGVVRKSWSFLGEVYYTVEFTARAVVVILRAHEMVTASWR